MVGLIGGCLRRVVSLLVVAAAVLLAWSHRAELQILWIQLRAAVSGEPQEPSRALAEVARAKLERLAEEDSPERIVLSEAEVQSLIRFGPGLPLPDYIVSPVVRFERDRVHLRALVPTANFPQAVELGEVIGFLPDTAEVTAIGQLIPLPGPRVGLAIDEVSASRMPLPRGLIPVMLRRMGRTDEPGLPPDAVPLPLPAGAAAAYVRNGSLVLVTDRARNP